VTPIIGSMLTRKSRSTAQLIISTEKRLPLSRYDRAAPAIKQH